MPWKEFPSGARMFVPKGKFEEFQAARFWAGFNGAISGRVVQSLKKNPNETVQLRCRGKCPSEQKIE